MLQVAPSPVGVQSAAEDSDSDLPLPSITRPYTSAPIAPAPSTAVSAKATVRWVLTASSSTQKNAGSSQPSSSEFRSIAQIAEPTAPAPSTPAAMKKGIPLSPPSP